MSLPPLKTQMFQGMLGSVLKSWADWFESVGSIVAGLGTMATQNASSVAITGGSISGVQILTPIGAFINKFRNGTFDVAQRGASGTVTSGNTAYTLDGWRITATGSSAAWSQQWNINIAGNALRINAATGLTSCTVDQRIESHIAAELLTAAKSGQPVCVQFTIHNGMAVSITPQIASGYASSRDNFTSMSADLAATNLQAVPAGQTGVVSYIFTPNANIANGMQVQLLLGSALNGASGYVEIARADARVFPNGATGLNGNPPAPELRPNETEICQEYYEVTTAAFTSYVNSGSGYGSFVPFAVRKRASPTCSFLVSVTATSFPSSAGYFSQQRAEGFVYEKVANATGGGRFCDTIAATAEL